MVAQTVEQFLFEQLDKLAPGKYTLANVLQLFKSKLRFSCTHLKGSRLTQGLIGPAKDYNLSVFTFPNGVTEIRCLYNCGLKVRSDEKELVGAFNELYDLPSTNTRAAAEVQRYSKGGKDVPVDPGPVPTYSDEYRKRLRESTDLFWKSLEQGLESGRIQSYDPILGGIFPHPGPVEAPDSQIERGIKNAFEYSKKRPPVVKAQVVVQDSIPALEPVKTNTKIRKARKTQSRKRG
jgi:hypothetical protein